MNEPLPQEALAGPRTGSATSVADRVLGLMARMRGSWLERVRQVNALTEREVMGAGSSVGDIVQRSREYLEGMKQLLAGLREGSHHGALAAAIGRQADTVRSHARTMTEKTDNQSRAANRASEQTKSIEKAARSVEKLASQSTILALNARIEAGRIGEKAQGFSVLASEMSRLSKEMAQANNLIRDLATELGRVIPEIAVGATAMKETAATFAHEITTRLADVETEAAALQSTTARAMQQSDEAMAFVLRASQEALSHLQFQDIVAQGLLRADEELQRLQIEAGEALGVDARPEIAPPAHVEIGGDKAITTSGAGEVLLF